MGPVLQIYAAYGKRGAERHERTLYQRGVRQIAISRDLKRRAPLIVPDDQLEAFRAKVLNSFDVFTRASQNSAVAVKDPDLPYMILTVQTFQHIIGVNLEMAPSDATNPYRLYLDLKLTSETARRTRLVTHYPRSMFDLAARQPAVRTIPPVTPCTSAARLLGDFICDELGSNELRGDAAVLGTVGARGDARRVLRQSLHTLILYGIIQSSIEASHA